MESYKKELFEMNNDTKYQNKMLFFAHTDDNFMFYYPYHQEIKTTFDYKQSQCYSVYKMLEQIKDKYNLDNIKITKNCSPTNSMLYVNVENKKI